MPKFENPQYERSLRYEAGLGDLAGLISALQIVLWDLGQEDLKTAYLNERREALIGLGNALERVVNSTLNEEERKQ